MPMLAFVVGPPFVGFRALAETGVDGGVVTTVFFGLFCILVSAERRECIGSSVRAVRPVSFFAVFVPLG